MNKITESEIYIKYGKPCFPLFGLEFYKLCFPNGYGAGILKNFDGGELFTLGVTKKVTDEIYNLCYTTPITDDVLYDLTIDDVFKALEKIKALPGKADEIFKKLGYEENTFIFHKDIVRQAYTNRKKTIHFNRDETVNILSENTKITPQELEAVVQKCKELGWIKGE